MISREEIEQLCFDAQEEIPSELERSVCQQQDARLYSPDVPAHYYRFLYWYCKKFNPRFCLELGTNTGISAACLAEGSHYGVVWTVDVEDHLKEENRRHNIKYIHQDSLAELILPLRIDLLFIDTDHDGVRPLKEFEKYLTRMSNESIIFFDDINLNDAMKEFWSNFNPDGWEKVSLPIHGATGFGALIRS